MQTDGPHNDSETHARTKTRPDGKTRDGNLEKIKTGVPNSARVKSASRTKRRRSDDEYDDDEDHDEAGNEGGVYHQSDADESAARTERKLMRERKRRGQLNEALDTMASLVFEIDSSFRSGLGSTSDNHNESSAATISNRVDLINCAVSILKRIHSENENRKVILSELMKSGALANSELRQLDLTPASTDIGGLSVPSSSTLSGRMRLLQQVEASNLIEAMNRRSAEEHELQHQRLQLAAESSRQHDLNQFLPAILQSTMANRLQQSSLQLDALRAFLSSPDDQSLLHGEGIGADTRARLEATYYGRALAYNTPFLDSQGGLLGTGSAVDNDFRSMSIEDHLLLQQQLRHRQLQEQQIRQQQQRQQEDLLSRILASGRREAISLPEASFISSSVSDRTLNPGRSTDRSMGRRTGYAEEAALPEGATSSSVAINRYSNSSAKGNDCQPRGRCQE